MAFSGWFAAMYPVANCERSRGSVPAARVLGGKLPPVEVEIWRGVGAACEEAEATRDGECAAKEAAGRDAAGGGGEPRGTVCSDRL